MLGFNASGLATPAQSIYYEMKSLKTNVVILKIPEAQINLTNNRDQETNNISSEGNEGTSARAKVKAPTLAEPLSTQSWPWAM